MGNSQHINPLLLLPHAPPIQIVFLFILGNKYCSVYLKIPFFFFFTPLLEIERKKLCIDDQC